MTDREKILLAGVSNTGKTKSLINLALAEQGHNVVILDPDDGSRKVIRELGIEPAMITNLTILPVLADWQAMLANYRAVKSILRAGDWFCIDMMGRMWDLAQQYYSLKVFGQDPIEHLLTLRAQASRVSFEGFDGLQDWSLIKRLHNELLVDDAVLYSSFNVMCTTSLTSIIPIGREKAKPAGAELLLAEKFGMKLEGEKHNYYRFDTIAVTMRKDSQFIYRLIKDRGRPFNPDEEHNMTGVGFWTTYKGEHNLA